MGRYPPKKSAVSVCWLQLMTMSVWPRTCAATWHTVVLPVPVSPTSSTGSPAAMALSSKTYMRRMPPVQTTPRSRPVGASGPGTRAAAASGSDA